MKTIKGLTSLTSSRRSSLTITTWIRHSSTLIALRGPSPARTVAALRQTLIARIPPRFSRSKHSRCRIKISTTTQMCQWLILWTLADQNLISAMEASKKLPHTKQEGLRLKLTHRLLLWTTDCLISRQVNCRCCKRILTPRICPFRTLPLSRALRAPLSSRICHTNTRPSMKRQNWRANMLMISRARVTKRNIRRKTKLWPSRAGSGTSEISPLSFTTPSINLWYSTLLQKIEIIPKGLKTHRGQQMGVVMWAW
jgi:hypothetical protein